MNSNPLELTYTLLTIAIIAFVLITTILGLIPKYLTFLSNSIYGKGCWQPVSVQKIFGKHFFSISEATNRDNKSTLTFHVERRKNECSLVLVHDDELGNKFKITHETGLMSLDEIQNLNIHDHQAFVQISKKLLKHKNFYSLVSNGKNTTLLFKTNIFAVSAYSYVEKTSIANMCGELLRVVKN